MSGEAVVAMHGLTKRFGDLVAVDSLDLEVVRGEVFGFLGPNGTSIMLPQKRGGTLFDGVDAAARCSSPS